MTALSTSDFAGFFEEVYGYEPFPWQQQLLDHVVRSGGTWPAVLELPTGSGKTAAIDIAIFHLALDAADLASRRAPVRVAFVVDRRLVVDDAYERSKHLAAALRLPPGDITAEVARRLQQFSADGPPLVVRRLRGGVPRENDWARVPSQPTVLCSTVDQVGSRLMFRGYGVSDSMKPVNAGLLGSDCRLLLDEAHLAEPFRQLLGWVEMYRGPAWREETQAAPWGATFLSATPARKSTPVIAVTPANEDARPFALGVDDWEHPVLSRRLRASKPAALVVVKDTSEEQNVASAGQSRAAQSLRARTLIQEVTKCLAHFEDVQHQATHPAIGLIVNRVARAREVFDMLCIQLKDEIANGMIAPPVLLIGPARSVDRDRLVKDLDQIRTRAWGSDEMRKLDKTFIVVATQCIEAGVDIDLDGMITELAPLDSLRQRFGRLNRSGRRLMPFASVVAMRSDLAAAYDDPIYGTALRVANQRLEEARMANDERTIEFGISGFSVELDPDAFAPTEDAPVLLPAHLDLLTHTSPIPAADPDLSLYLHGEQRQPDSVSIIWRADIVIPLGHDGHREPIGDGAPDPATRSSRSAEDQMLRRLLIQVPPRNAEAIALPVWAVRRWLQDGGRRASDALADVPGAEPEPNRDAEKFAHRLAFRWRGDSDASRWIEASEIRPGDCIVIPTLYGGIDQFGWNPRQRRSTVDDEFLDATDVARDAAAPFRGVRFAVRIAPGLLGSEVSAVDLRSAIAGAATRHWRSVRASLSSLPMPDAVRTDLSLLDKARGGRVVAHLDLYGMDSDGRPSGVVFIAQAGIRDSDSNSPEHEYKSATEDDIAGSLPGFALGLDLHNEDVAHKAREFATIAGLSSARVADLECAGSLHDLGKADHRYQGWLSYGDPLGADDTHLLAKSARRLPRKARSESALPTNWRHEALSVRVALGHTRLEGAVDPELVLWLVGSHHGYGRPLFPHADSTENAPDVGPQALSFEWRGMDWPSLFTRVKQRYGCWELARMEAVLRLADHRASEARELREEERQ